MGSAADLQRLLGVVDELDAVQEAISVAARSGRSERKSEIVQLRRELAEHIVAVGALASATLAQDDAALLAEFRTKLSKMRTEVALHQANWPAVSLDEAPAEYQNSALGVGRARKEFVSWARTAIGAKLTKGRS